MEKIKLITWEEARQEVERGNLIRLPGKGWLRLNYHLSRFFNKYVFVTELNMCIILTDYDKANKAQWECKRL